ncbi:glycoside hydrolase family 30 beta sandwich domain-containing protein [Chitinophaga sp. sic0106]|uniref:glycoside hydrolase family 30 protein n=1 Tax=Chitinophaga sp. sic0106 TaxID=2854785 RepID=UPI001C469C11|nr:glycoside hydrolase family 30 protein [Chitinophaga sp. sic0106]MBV7529091.1 glycosyl hydrolase [Chitinophaga sp. sic0106]
MKKTILAGAAFLAFVAQGYSQQKKVTVYTTAQNTEMRLAQNGTLEFHAMPQPFETEPCVFVDPKVTFQTFQGIGGALTDASAETFYKLPKEKQAELLKAYFNVNNGIGYTFSRTNIASCDFSSGTYAYVADNDSALKTFNVQHDLQYKVPFIKAATQAAGGTLPLFVSPWSPPAWMKDNNSVLQGGKLLPRFYQAWSNHYVKFIKAYEAMGIPVWGLSVQNEPMAKQRWESCIFTAEEERDFIKKFLGPTLAKNGLGNKKLIAWDHNRDLLYQRASTLLQDKEAAKYIWGIGYHWYETWTGSDMQFQNEKLVNQAFPNINLVFTEGCIEKFDFNRLQDWAIGEKYGYSLVNDFNSGTVAWTDWNILLDENGGPNHVGNFCFAPVHADTKKGELIYTNAYYYLGHFSKFIRPGAKRVVSSSSRSQLQTTAFINKDGKLAVVVLNASDKEIKYNLWISGKAAPAVSQPHSINTLIVE